MINIQINILTQTTKRICDKKNSKMYVLIELENMITKTPPNYITKTARRKNKPKSKRVETLNGDHRNEVNTSRFKFIQTI